MISPNVALSRSEYIVLWDKGFCDILRQRTLDQYRIQVNLGFPKNALLYMAYTTQEVKVKVKVEKSDITIAKICSFSNWYSFLENQGWVVLYIDQTAIPKPVYILNVFQCVTFFAEKCFKNNMLLLTSLWINKEYL